MQLYFYSLILGFALTGCVTPSKRTKSKEATPAAQVKEGTKEIVVDTIRIPTLEEQMRFFVKHQGTTQHLEKKSMNLFRPYQTLLQTVL